MVALPSSHSLPSLDWLIILRSFLFSGANLLIQSTSVMAYSAVTRLPLLDEIWSRIFEYLPVDDRKNVRLTCRRFYDIAKCASLLESEEHVFPGNVTIAAIGSLADSSRKIWNLKFVQVNLTADSGFLSFFRKQGAGVRSLTFDQCPVMIPELIQFMIVNCANLRSFAMNIDYEREERILSDYVLDDFNSLCDDGIIRQHVSSFTLTVPYYFCEPTNAQFVNFFTIFPNIKELNFQIDSFTL